MVLLLINDKSYNLDNKVIAVDKSAKSAYIYLKSANEIIDKIYQTQDINSDKQFFMINLDIDKNKKPLGIEILFKNIKQLDMILKGISMVYPSVKIVDITEGFKELSEIKNFNKVVTCENNTKEIFVE
jgi:hypothetical protein